MPQMSCLNWVVLSLFFLTSYILILCFIYPFFNPYVSLEGSLKLKKEVEKNKDLIFWKKWI